MSPGFYKGKPIIEFDGQSMSMIRMMKDTLPSFLSGVARGCIQNNAVIDGNRVCLAAEISEKELKKALDTMKKQYGIKSKLIKDSGYLLIEFKQ